MQSFSRMRVRALFAACAAYALVILPIALHAQVRTYTLDDFRRLHFLLGDWRGVAGSTPFHERYRLLNDSTLETTHTDSTFTTVSDRSITALRGGAIVHENANGSARWLASAVGDGAVSFERAGGGFTWNRRTADEWVAVLRAGNGRTTEYVMTRVRPRS